MVMVLKPISFYDSKLVYSFCKGFEVVIILVLGLYRPLPRIKSRGADRKIDDYGANPLVPQPNGR